jgi:ABC-2 type transport system permease protein
MRAFLSMVRSNLKMTLRDRTVLFWLLLFPAVLIVVFGALVDGNSDSKISVGVVNAEAMPVAISTQGIQGKNMSYVDFLVPGVLAMSVMNGGIVGLSAAFVVMRERSVLRRIKVTPFPMISFITARVATQLLVALCQAAILLGLAKLIFNLDIVGNLLEVAVFISLGSLTSLTIGFFVAGVSRKQESATALAQLISFPMLFLSGVFFPLDRSPVWLQDVAKALPLTYLADGLRQVMAYGASLTSLWGDLLALVLTTAIGLALAVRFFRWEPRVSSHTRRKNEPA